MKKFVVAFIKLSAWAIPVAVLCAFAYMMVNNTKPREVKDCVVTINVVEAKSNKATDDEVQISKRALENTLQQSAYAARQEAQNEYDRNFSTLLTILTIFGIAWPLIVAFAQYKFNKSELKKIQRAERKAADSLSEAEAARKEIKETDKSINDLVDLLRKTNGLFFVTQAMFCKNLEVAIGQVADDKKSIINQLMTLRLFCRCMKIRFDGIKDSSCDDIKRLQAIASKIYPEEQADECSRVTKNTIAKVYSHLKKLCDDTENIQNKKALDELMKRINTLYETYKQLVPDTSKGGGKN